VQQSRGRCVIRRAASVLSTDYRDLWAVLKAHAGRLAKFGSDQFFFVCFFFFFFFVFFFLFLLFSGLNRKRSLEKLVDLRDFEGGDGIPGGAVCVNCCGAVN